MFSILCYCHLLMLFHCYCSSPHYLHHYLARFYPPVLSRCHCMHHRILLILLCHFPLLRCVPSITIVYSLVDGCVHHFPLLPGSSFSSGALSLPSVCPASVSVIFSMSWSALLVLCLVAEPFVSFSSVPFNYLSVPESCFSPAVLPMGL